MNAHFRSAPPPLLLTKELLAAGRRLRPLSNLPAHFSRDGVSLFQATVSNRPEPPIPGHCEMQPKPLFSRGVSYVLCTPLIPYLWDKTNRNLERLISYLETGLDSAACRVKRCVIAVCFF